MCVDAVAFGARALYTRLYNALGVRSSSLPRSLLRRVHARGAARRRRLDRRADRASPAGAAWGAAERAAGRMCRQPAAVVAGAAPVRGAIPGLAPAPRARAEPVDAHRSPGGLVQRAP